MKGQARNMFAVEIFHDLLQKHAGHRDWSPNPLLLSPPAPTRKAPRKSQWNFNAVQQTSNQKIA